MRLKTKRDFAGADHAMAAYARKPLASSASARRMKSTGTCRDMCNGACTFKGKDSDGNDGGCGGSIQDGNCRNASGSRLLGSGDWDADAGTMETAKAEEVHEFLNASVAVQPGLEPAGSTFDKNLTRMLPKIKIDNVCEIIFGCELLSIFCNPFFVFGM